MVNIESSTLAFLSELKANNNRDWFQENKARFQSAKENFEAFTHELFQQSQEQDKLESMKVFRIYRDVRFAKDKTPYKTNFSGVFKRASALRRGSYYLQIGPEGQTSAGGGFWGPNKDDMQLIRSKIAADPAAFRRVLYSSEVLRLYGEMKGEKVKTAPKGYKKDHPAIELLRYKQFFLDRTFTDEEVLSDQFMDLMVETFAGLRPFFDYMSEVLTTNLDGEPLYREE